MSKAETKLLALAIFELRTLLSDAGEKDAPYEFQFAWRLAYALHNDALAVLEDKDFDHEAALARIAGIDQVIGGNDGKRLAERFRQISSENSV